MNAAATFVLVLVVILAAIFAASGVVAAVTLWRAADEDARDRDEMRRREALRVVLDDHTNPSVASADFNDRARSAWNAAGGRGEKA